MLVKLAIPPGVYRNATPYAAGPRWHDVNLVRWIDSTMTPIGGWNKFSADPIVGTCRGLFAWKDNSGDAWLAVGTSSKLYIHEGGSLTDITPVGFVPGETSARPGRGFGVGLFGRGPWGTPRAASPGLVLDAATWSFDAWGENLVGCSTSDGKIYEWQLTASLPAAVIANAPTQCRAVFVSDQRHLVALGADGDGRKVKWSHSEDNTVWAPSSTNQAGDFLLSSSGLLRCGIKTQGEYLLLTSNDAHVMRYINYPLVFGFQRAGTNCGVAGPNAAVAVEGGVMWMGPDARFYVYDGSVRNIPCEVEAFVEDEFKKVGQSEVYAGTLAEKGEVWWYFPTSTATRYVIFNYRSNTWSIGQLDRIAWIDRGAWKHPVGASSTGDLYQHEDGLLNNGATRVGSVYAQSGALEVGNGDLVADVVQLLPDEKTRGDVAVTFKSQYTPNGEEYVYGPYTVRTDGYTDVRASGRQMKLRVEPVTDNDWQWGTPRADIRPSGER